MLSLKMKRLCSRVIASLSALGVFTIGKPNVSYAVDVDYSVPTFYGKGGTLRYAVSSAKKHVSNYGDSRCLTGVSSLIESHTYSEGGSTGLCVFKCKSNTAYANDGNGGFVTGFSVSGVKGSNIDAKAYSCKSLYTITYDCTSSGLISGTSSRTATAQALYGSSFKINKTCAPIAGFAFDGWVGGS